MIAIVKNTITIYNSFPLSEMFSSCMECNQASCLFSVTERCDIFRKLFSMSDIMLVCFSLDSTNASSNSSTAKSWYSYYMVTQKQLRFFQNNFKCLICFRPFLDRQYKKLNLIVSSLIRPVFRHKSATYSELPSNMRTILQRFRFREDVRKENVTPSYSLFSKLK